MSVTGATIIANAAIRPELRIGGAVLQVFPRLSLDFRHRELRFAMRR